MILCTLGIMHCHLIHTRFPLTSSWSWFTSHSLSSRSLATNFTQGLASYLKSADGTPLCPHCPLEVYMFELYDEPDKDVAQGMSETFYGISMYEGGNLIPKFPLGTNCSTVPPSPHPAANGGASTIGRSLFGILGIRELLQLLVMVVLRWPSLGWENCNMYIDMCVEKSRL